VGNGSSGPRPGVPHRGEAPIPKKKAGPPDRSTTPNPSQSGSRMNGDRRSPTPTSHRETTRASSAPSSTSPHARTSGQERHDAARGNMSSDTKGTGGAEVRQGHGRVIYPFISASERSAQRSGPPLHALPLLGVKVQNQPPGKHGVGTIAM